MDPPTLSARLRTPTSSPTRILLVDDDEDYAHFLQRMIRRSPGPHRIDVVHDEASARRALEGGQYDLILSDYDLKSGNGLRVFEHARVNHPLARRILVTGTPQDVPAQAPGADAVAHGVWDKGWTPATIHAYLATVLRPRP